MTLFFLVIKAAFTLGVLTCCPLFSWATCVLPVTMPPGFRPAGAAMGPKGELVLVSDTGGLVFVDVDDYAISRYDTALTDKYLDSYGVLDLEGCEMLTNSSDHLYFATHTKSNELIGHSMASACILEYEWHKEIILRRYSLVGFERVGGGGVESITWVPNNISQYGGYFFVGSMTTGHIFVYELPTGVTSMGGDIDGKLITTWTPLQSETDVASLCYSDGYIFVNYDDGASSHILIYPVMAMGLPGDLKEQYRVDAPTAEGMAVQKISDDTWEIFFSSNSRRQVFAYAFRFVTGFELHRHCSGLEKQLAREVRPSGSSKTRPWLAAQLLPILAIIAVTAAAA